jgi:hypothetical protein
MNTLRKKFNRGHRYRWAERLDNNLEECFVNVAAFDWNRLGTSGEFFF